MILHPQYLINVRPGETELCSPVTDQHSFFSCLYGYQTISFFINYSYKSLMDGKVMDAYNKWLTINELASYIKMSRTKLYGMTQRGELPASRIGNQWRFDREEIDLWMKAHATGRGRTQG